MPSDSKSRQNIQGDNAVGIQIDGDSNTVTIFESGSKLVLDQPHKRRGNVPPANERQLLLTEWRATTLVGREDELAMLAAWHHSSPRVLVRCITGRAGSGKTRLAIEACERADAEGWTAGFVSGDELRRFHTMQNLAVWRSPNDTLIVVDDAAAVAGILKDWMAALARRPEQESDRKLRLLLLDRHADPDSDYGWWADLTRPDSLARAGASDLIGAERPIPLAILPGVEERRSLLAEAMRLASSILGKPVIAPPPPGQDENFDLRLADNRLENEPLFLIMAGIVAAERGTPSTLSLGRLTLAKEMAILEQARLGRFGAGHGLPANGELICHLAACASLQRGCTATAARAMVEEEIAAMPFASEVSVEQVLDVLAETLPATGDAAVDRVRPDLIGEAFVIREIVGTRFRTDEQRLAIIERAHRRDEENVVATLVLAAQDFAAGTPNHPAVGWLAHLVARSTNVEQLMRISDGLPTESLALREIGVAVCEKITDYMRSGSAPGGEKFLATALNNLAIRLGDLGRLEPALAAARESVEIRRALAEADPERFAGELALGLDTLANRLGQIGRLQEAFDTSHECVLIRRRLAADQPEIFRAQLATTLNNQCIHARGLGRLEEALVTIEEAVEIRRHLEAEHPGLYAADLASGLHNLGVSLSALGHLEASLQASEEALGLYRALSAAQPDTFSHHLGAALINLASCLSACGRHETALHPAEEAVEIYRRLAGSRPNVFLAELATSLNNLSIHLHRVGRLQEALAPSREAIEIRRLQATERPEAFALALAGGLQTLANRLLCVGEFAEATETATEALGMFRALGASHPDPLRHRIAACLGTLAICHQNNGDLNDALNVAQEAVDLYRLLALQRPVAFEPELARSLSSLADMVEAKGDVAAAAVLDHESLATLAPYFLANPKAFAAAVRSYAQDYLRRTETAGSALDIDLLETLVEKLDELRQEPVDGN